MKSLSAAILLSLFLISYNATAQTVSVNVGTAEKKTETDFYEWIGHITLGRWITEGERKAIKLLVMRMLYTAIKPTEAQDEIPFWWYLKTYLKEKDASKKERTSCYG